MFLQLQFLTDAFTLENVDLFTLFIDFKLDSCGFSCLLHLRYLINVSTFISHLTFPQQRLLKIITVFDSWYTNIYSNISQISQLYLSFGFFGIAQQAFFVCTKIFSSVERSSSYITFLRSPKNRTMSNLLMEQARHWKILLVCRTFNEKWNYQKIPINNSAPIN